MEGRGGAAIGAFAEGGLVGITMVRYRLADSTAQLAALFVDAAHRRQGIAAALTGEVIRLARDEGARELYVSATPSAVGFYTSQGFRLAERVNQELYEREPADIHMLRALWCGGRPGRCTRCSRHRGSSFGCGILTQTWRSSAIHGGSWWLAARMLRDKPTVAVHDERVLSVNLLIVAVAVREVHPIGVGLVFIFRRGVITLILPSCLIVVPCPAVATLLRDDVRLVEIGRVVPVLRGCAPLPTPLSGVWPPRALEYVRLVIAPIRASQVLIEVVVAIVELPAGALDGYPCPLRGGWGCSSADSLAESVIATE